MSHELVAYLGVMDAGKSTLALQYHHSLGGTGVVYTSMDRGGEGVVSSRIGLSHEAREVKPGFDIYDDLAAIKPPYVIVDEVQFLDAGEHEDADGRAHGLSIAHPGRTAPRLLG